MNRSARARLADIERRKPEGVPRVAKACRDAAVSAALVAHRVGGLPIAIPSDPRARSTVEAALRADT